MLPSIVVPDGVEIGANVTRIRTDAQVTARVIAAFAECHAVILPSALNGTLLQMILSACRHGLFAPEHIGKIGWRTVEERDFAGRALRFALQRPEFLLWLESIAECGELHSVAGFVAEMAAGTGQGLGWHNDLNEGGLGRRLAVTVHLSDTAYEGGLFELREKATERILVRVGALPLGSVMIFRIDQRLSHRVTELTDGGPRRVFAGWFSV
jgi:hypothetical protein